MARVPPGAPHFSKLFSLGSHEVYHLKRMRQRSTGLNLQWTTDTWSIISAWEFPARHVYLLIVPKCWADVASSHSQTFGFKGGTRLTQPPPARIWRRYLPTTYKSQPIATGSLTDRKSDNGKRNLLKFWRMTEWYNLIIIYKMRKQKDKRKAYTRLDCRRTILCPPVAGPWNWRPSIRGSEIFISHS